jgi:hypothetical protein
LRDVQRVGGRRTSSAPASSRTTKSIRNRCRLDVSGCTVQIHETRSAFSAKTLRFHIRNRSHGSRIVRSGTAADRGCMAAVVHVERLWRDEVQHDGVTKAGGPSLSAEDSIH